MPRAKKKVEETEVKKTTVKKASPKKTTAKKTVSTKSVTQKTKKEPKVTKSVPKFSSLDDISVDSKEPKSFIEENLISSYFESTIKLLSQSVHNFLISSIERADKDHFAYLIRKNGFLIDLI